MKTLYSLPMRSHQYISVAEALPVQLTVEERRKSWLCRSAGCFVTAFSCLQCKHFEVYNEIVRMVTKTTGKCKFPRVASKQSRKITRWSPFGNDVRGKGKKLGGMSDKVDFAIQLMKQGNSRRDTIIAVMTKFNIGKGYASAIQYQAKKAIEKERVQ